VVLDVGVIERDHAVEVAVLPAQVVAQHGLSGSCRVFGTVRLKHGGSVGICSGIAADCMNWNNNSSDRI